MADEWNEAGAAVANNADPSTYVKRIGATDDMDTRSALTYNSSKTAASKKSLRSQVLEAIQEEGGSKAEWDRSTRGDQANKINTTEDRIA